MKIRVDKGACIGCGACEAVCPQVFRLGEDGLAEVIVPVIGADLKDLVIDAVEGCPVSAIHVEE